MKTVAIMRAALEKIATRRGMWADEMHSIAENALAAADRAPGLADDDNVRSLVIEPRTIVCGECGRDMIELSRNHWHCEGCGEDVRDPVIQVDLATPPSDRCARKGCGCSRDSIIHAVRLKTPDSDHHDFVVDFKPPKPKCATCGGTGRRVYGSTAGKRGGIAYQAALEDDCSACNGTGRAKGTP